MLIFIKSQGRISSNKRLVEFPRHENFMARVITSLSTNERCDDKGNLPLSQFLPLSTLNFIADYRLFLSLSATASSLRLSSVVLGFPLFLVAILLTGKLSSQSLFFHQFDAVKQQVEILVEVEQTVQTGYVFTSPLSYSNLALSLTDRIATVDSGPSVDNLEAFLHFKLISIQFFFQIIC